MTHQILQPLPLGSSDFTALRSCNQIYVDKTALIYEIASKRAKFFLTRPRRFGKSLLVSTFKALFKHGLRDFKGLAIEKLWSDTGTYRVVRLDFSLAKNFHDFDDFVLHLNWLIADVFRPHGFAYDPNATEPICAQLSTWLKTIPDDSLVLLIDEYDAPLTASLNDVRLFRAVREELSKFYAAIKSNDAAVRFFFMTGITNFGKTSFLSGLKDLTDLTLQAEYGTLLGYTHEEVEKYFGEYLDRAAEVLDVDRSKLLSNLTNHYEGYCFDRKASSRVFAPWSLLKFFDSPEEGYLNYWFESGGSPSVLLRTLPFHSLRNPEEYGRRKLISLSCLSHTSDITTISDIELLMQTGYLTIKTANHDDTVSVDYPNGEVRRSMAQLYTEQLLNGRSAGQVGAGPIVKVLATDNAESLFHILNLLFASINYDQYQIKNEHTVRAFAQVYMAAAGLDPKIEVPNLKGHSGLEVTVENRHWVIEFKFCREGENAGKLLEEAVEQIQSKHYGKQADSKELIRMALVFSEKERQFVKWTTV